MQLRANRNSVRRTSDVYGFLEQQGRDRDFAMLMQIVRLLLTPGTDKASGGADILCSHNHGDGRRLFGEERSRAVLIIGEAVGVLGNHIRTDANFAFDVDGSDGLFTDNLSDRDNLIVPSALAEPPNRTNL